MAKRAGGGPCACCTPRAKRIFLAFWGIVQAVIVSAVFDAGTLGRICLFYRVLLFNTIPFEVVVKDIRYSFYEPQHAYTEPNLQFKPGDDHATKICRLNMYMKLAEEVHSGRIMSPITDPKVTLPPDERAEAYVRTCLKVMDDMPEDQRKILDALDPVPAPWQFHINVTHPWMSGPYERGNWNGLDALMRQPPGIERPPDSRHQWTQERERRAEALPSLDHRRKPPEETQDLPRNILEGFRQLGIWPVRDETVEVADIPQALRDGRTMVFDATRLCGKDVFNLTMPDIARLHGEHARDIPIFKVNSAGYGDGTYDTLEELGHRFETWNAKGWQNYTDYGPFSTEEQRIYDLITMMPESSFTMFMLFLTKLAAGASTDQVRARLAIDWRRYKSQNSQVSINVKRLHRYPLQDLYKNMGSPSWVDRLWNLLWIGPVGDFWHFDEEDNLLICMSGNLYVAVMEQNYTSLVAGTRNVGVGYNDLLPFFDFRNPAQRHWVDDNPWIRKVPIHFLKLKPGMGITVPSLTYHNVMAFDGNRILMNCFFLPKWKALEDAPSIENSWWKPGRQADTYRAMWNLKVRSISRLWDEQRIGGFFKGYKLEQF